MNGPVTIYKYHSFRGQGEKQQGAVLIVSLVMLTILTTIALGTMTDTSLQSNMARNSQISLRVFNLSMSELKAQVNSVQNNSQINGKPYRQTLADIRQTQNALTVPQADLLMTSVNNPFDQDVVIRFMREGLCGGGNEIGVSGLIFEMDSHSELNNGTGTGINSDQSFGLCYPNASKNKTDNK